LAPQGKHYAGKKTWGGWIIYANSTVIRPFERAGRKPQKMRLPHERLTINQFIQHSRYWLKNS
jgi:hypothetical protein